MSLVLAFSGGPSMIRRLYPYVGNRGDPPTSNGFGQRSSDQFADRPATLDCREQRVGVGRNGECRHVRDRPRGSATAGRPPFGACRLAGGGPVLSAGEMFFSCGGCNRCRGGLELLDRRSAPRPSRGLPPGEALDQIGVVHPGRFTTEIHLPPLPRLRRAERGQGRLVRVPGLRGRVAAGMELQ